ncbi:glutamate racemase [Chitinophaga skermanii]|uniref:Glutamate racemase n=1 Tax=Chitinophaga skermanii TaxID=331697 RepID=A0A327QXH2_9BACT|nr:glutamate racemase [Chitinophaga skermanii]RAJ08424.1 glutamate racemase [Chitinophaga skermanii]
MKVPGPIGVFDSGYGGLTVLKEFVKQLPEYDYLYLGDNARAPYGTRSFETVYHYTLECVQHLFDMGCNLIVLACNTASAKALRSIQQNDLPKIAPGKRVLGVIRPTTEIVGKYTQTQHVGIMGTAGTVASGSYPIEIEKFYPDIKVTQKACPMWVPLVENNEWNKPGADYFVQKYIDELLSEDDKIDTIVLGCTHYPLLIEKIKQYVPNGTAILSQGEIVAASLTDYLQRHPEMEVLCSKNATRQFYTTDDPGVFDRMASVFFDTPITSQHLAL